LLSYNIFLWRAEDLIIGDWDFGWNLLLDFEFFHSFVSNILTHDGACVLQRFLYPVGMLGNKVLCTAMEMQAGIRDRCILNLVSS
jgi:hypothetical protein